jgi:hypothetical protein
MFLGALCIHNCSQHGSRGIEPSNEDSDNLGIGVVPDKAVVCNKQRVSALRF